MGKTKKAKVSRPGQSERGQASLPYQIAAEDGVKASNRNKSRYKGDDVNDDEVDDQFVSASISRKIISEARRQQQELEEEHGLSTDLGATAAPSGASRQVESDEESDNEVPPTLEYQEKEIRLSKEDEEAFEVFRNPNPTSIQRLSDLFQEKLTEKKTEIMTQLSDISGGVAEEEVPPGLASLVRKSAHILAHYSSGKLPKVLNMLPQMRNFEQLLMMLNPDKWSAAAMLGMTAKCMSTKPQRATKFVRLVLLPRIRDDIKEYRRLNFHLYQAMAKTLFKPQAFFKGIIFPLCDADCTLREATIIASLISKVSIPPLHVATGLMFIADRPYSGACSIFMQALLGKKTSLPYSAIDSVVAHFVRFTLDKRDMPVLWHQCLLTFVQHYRTEVTDEQRSELLHLCQAHRHHAITPEIYRQFEGCRVRGDPADVEMG